MSIVELDSPNGQGKGRIPRRKAQMRGPTRVPRVVPTRRMTRGLTRAAVRGGFALALLAALAMVTGPSPARAAVTRSSGEWIAPANTITEVPAANEFLVEARVALAQQALAPSASWPSPGTARRQSARSPPTPITSRLCWRAAARSARSGSRVETPASRRDTPATSAGAARVTPSRWSLRLRRHHRR